MFFLLLLYFLPYGVTNIVLIYYNTIPYTLSIPLIVTNCRRNHMISQNK